VAGFSTVTLLARRLVARWGLVHNRVQLAACSIDLLSLEIGFPKI
jgi:hypothetical protein